MRSNIRIDVTCNVCGGEHQIFVQSNRVGHATSFRYECPEKHEPVVMPANSYHSMEAVPIVPLSAIMATVVE